MASSTEISVEALNRVADHLYSRLAEDLKEDVPAQVREVIKNEQSGLGSWARSWWSVISFLIIHLCVVIWFARGVQKDLSYAVQAIEKLDTTLTEETSGVKERIRDLEGRVSRLEGRQ